MATIKGSFIKYGNVKVSYEITDETKDKIIERLIQYYSEHLWYGEGIHQNDDAQIEAPIVLSHICDVIIQFEEGEL